MKSSLAVVKTLAATSRRGRDPPRAGLIRIRGEGRQACSIPRGCDVMRDVNGDVEL